MVVLRRAVPLFFVFASALLTLALALATRTAHAQATNPRAYPVHVLAIDSEDAEDQAEALTVALRSRVRAMPGWTLLDTSTSLTTLTAALKCPKVPDAACLGRIAEQLKTDRFVWGTMTKAPGNQVTADVHLYAKGKPDAEAKETYSDNLKDGNDETLRRLAQHIFDRLGGTVSAGTLALRAGDGAGIINVDGTRQGTLEKGEAKLELPAGPHTIEVIVLGFAPARETTTIVAGKDSTLTLNLVSDAADAKPFPTRKVIGFVAIGVGAALLVGGGLEGLEYVSISDKQKETRGRIGSDVTDVCQVTVGQPYYGEASEACDLYRKARTASAIGWVLAGVGVAAVGTGIYLLVTDTSSEGKPSADRSKARLRLIPELTKSTAGLHLSGTF